MSTTNEIARRVFLRVAAAKGIYNMSPDGFDIAQACPFIDATDIGLSLALASEIAAQAEETIEGGGTYTARVDIEGFYGRDLLMSRANTVFEAQGIEGVYQDVLKSKALYKGIQKVIRGGKSWPTKEFLSGNMPDDPFLIRDVMYEVRKGYQTADFPNLGVPLGSVERNARGILRDLGIQMKDTQLKVTYGQQPSSDPMRVSVSLNGEIFFTEDPLDLTDEILTPPTSLSGQNFLSAKGEAYFRAPFLGSQNLATIAKKLQSLNGALNHPDDKTREEAQEWVKSSHGVKSLYSYISSGSDTSREVNAAARGFIKRIVKDYDNATFDEDRVRAAKAFFGKDTKMLLQKCWNKSPLKQSFGALKISDEMLDLMITAICKRLSPLRRSKDDLAKTKPAVLTDVVTIIMVHCALAQMDVKLKPDFKSILRLW